MHRTSSCLKIQETNSIINHGILLSKLSMYGIQGKAHDWFTSYLSNRMQICSINGRVSDMCSLECGVPQGTILGPLLFLLYINDLPNCLSFAKPRMFADDTHVTYASNDPYSIQHHLDLDLNNVCMWLIANRLTLNMTKTEYMLIGSSQRLRNLALIPTSKINNISIKRVSSTKSLGVQIDDKLTWNDHIDQVVKKVSSGIGALKRVRPFVPFQILHRMYKTLVQPHFDYCSAVWANCGKTLVEKLQKLQNRAARVLTHSDYDADAKQLIEALGWKTLDKQRENQVASVVFKSLNGLAPEYLKSKFIQRSDTTSYNFRGMENKLSLPLPRTNYGKETICYRGAVVWNNLPCNVRQASSLSEFRKLLK